MSKTNDIEHYKKNVSLKWMTKFAEECSGGYDYPRDFTVEDILQVGRDYLATGEYCTLSYNTPDMAYGPEYWQHFEILTGTKVEFEPDQFEDGDEGAPFRGRSAPFNCSC